VSLLGADTLGEQSRYQETYMTEYTGGFGISPLGQSEMGHAQSTIEPRFYVSRPIDGSINVPTDTWLSFTTYNYSSWVDIEATTVEISEDNGVTFNAAFDGTNFIAPYDGALSKARYTDSHTIKFWIFKTSLWPVATTIYIRLTAQDEFGNVATKTAPVVW